MLSVFSPLSPFVVKYYGSYFKNTDLWVSRLTLSELQISPLCFATGCHLNPSSAEFLRL